MSIGTPQNVDPILRLSISLIKIDLYRSLCRALKILIIQSIMIKIMNMYTRKFSEVLANINYIII